MKSMWFSFRSIEYALYSVLMIMLFGCTSTPQHTNVLIFGTSTKVALDVSQDPTGSVGVTLGYRRQEAVWMPLLPNQSTTPSTTDLIPASCTTTECPMFVGLEGDNTDTYSVLASFGSKLGGGIDSQGKKAQVTGEIAQYFATGLAARELAKNGGPGLVNTNGNSTLTAAEKYEVEKNIVAMESELDSLLALLADPADPQRIDTARRDAAFAKSPGLDIDNFRKEQLKKAKTMDELKIVITDYPHRSVAKPMLVTLTTK